MLWPAVALEVVVDVTSKPRLQLLARMGDRTADAFIICWPSLAGRRAGSPVFELPLCTSHRPTRSGLRELMLASLRVARVLVG